MLDGIKPLANNVLIKLMQDHYPNWYTKYISVCYPNKVYSVLKKSLKFFKSIFK